jgi:hypothetical protein
VDATSVCGRLDFDGGVPEGDYRIVVNLEASKQTKTGKAASDSYRLQVDANGGHVQKWALTNGSERKKLASYASDNGNRSTRGVEVALGEIFEMRVPFELVGVQPGSKLRLRFALWRDDLPADSLPLEGWIELYALAEEELESNLYTYSAR